MSIRVPNINEIRVAGRVTRDPELRYTPNGKAVCNFGIANNRVWYDSTNQKKEEVTFFDVQAWEKGAENACRNLKKGSPVLLEGRMESREYVDKAGQKKRSWEIVANMIYPLEWIDDAPQTGQTNRPAQSARDMEAPLPSQAAPAAPVATEQYEFPDDDIPF